MDQWRTYLQALYDRTKDDRVSEPERLRERLKARLGSFPEGGGEIGADLIERVELDTHVRERYVLLLDEALECPVYVLTPKQTEGGPLPAVLALHGHGYGSREIVGLTEDGSEDGGELRGHKHFARELVARGFKVFAPEAAGLGDRMLESDRLAGKRNSCHTLSVHLMMAGRTLAGLRVHEAGLVLDWMGRLSDVDPERIGCIGFSGGALVTGFLTALDRRIKAAVVSGYVATFEGSTLALDHCIDNYVPGLLEAAELPELYGLAAPRALYLEAGTGDPIFPVESARTAIDRVRSIYLAAGVLERFGSDVFEGGHEICGIRSYEWLRRMV